MLVKHIITFMNTEMKRGHLRQFIERKFVQFTLGFLAKSTASLISSSNSVSMASSFLFALSCFRAIYRIKLSKQSQEKWNTVVAKQTVLRWNYLILSNFTYSAVI